MKNYLTKSQFNIFYTLILSVVVLLSSCSDEGDDEGGTEQGVTREDPKETPDSFDAENNEKGQSTLIIDVREFKKLGVQTAKVNLVFLDDELAQLSAELEVNQFLDTAQFLKENEDIGEEGLDKFNQGLVRAKAIAMNEAGESLAEKSFDLLSNGNRLAFEKEDLVESPEIDDKFYFEHGVPYFIKSKTTGQLWTMFEGFVSTDTSQKTVHLRQSEIIQNQGIEELINYQKVIFEETTLGSSYAHLKFAHSGQYLGVRDGAIYQENITDVAEIPPASFCSFLFKVEYVEGPYFRLIACDNDVIKNTPLDGQGFGLATPEHFTDAEISTATSDEYLFRLVPADIIFEVEDDGHNFGEFAFSEGNIDIAYAQTILNCSKATLTETVGQSETRESTRELSTEESFEVYSEQTSSFGVTAGVSAGFSAFGAEVTASLEVSTDHSFTSSSTTTNTKYFGFTNTVTTEVSREREIEVPPGSKLSVFDAVSTVEAVPIDFVHRYTLKGKRKGSGVYISGKALRSLLVSSNFGGVVLEEGSNFLKLSLRGTYHVDKLITTKTELMDLGECD